MNFKRTELDIVYQYASNTKGQTIAELKEIVPFIKDRCTKELVENTIKKLEEIPEAECIQFITNTKYKKLEERDNMILQKFAAVKEQNE